MARPLVREEQYAPEPFPVGIYAIPEISMVDYFLSTVFNYPTLAECYKVAAHNAANKLALKQSVEASAAREQKADRG